MGKTRWGIIEKLFYDAFESQNPGNSSPSVLVPYRNRSDVVDLVGREPLMFAKVENGVTKLCQFFAGKTGKTQFYFGMIFFTF